MASAFSHAAVAGALGIALLPRKTPWWVWATGVACAAAPDLDVIGFRLGIPYDSMLGHRGLSHSLLVAALAAAVLTALLRRAGDKRVAAIRLGIFLFLATASHGLCDALTNGGHGVAFFAPFDDDRYFFPWRPVEVSPIGVREFFSARGLEILRSELIWLWLPSFALAGLAVAVRRAR